MKKPQSLRDHLTAAVVDLRTNPERLLVFIERGTLRSTIAPGSAFEYSYQLKLVVTDFAGHPDAIMVPLLAWIRREQSELLTNIANREAIGFEAELVDNGAVDLVITLPLTERVGVKLGEDGKVTTEHFAEPQIEQPYPPTHWQLYLKDKLIAEWDAPRG